MIDHVYVSVSDFDTAVPFYTATLDALGWNQIGAFVAPDDPGVPDLFGFADKNYGSGTKIGASVWLRESQAGRGIYLGLVAGSHEAVNAAYEAAIHAGGTDGGAPGVREYFFPGYYAANVLDPDGNMLEIVNKSTNPQP